MELFSPGHLLVVAILAGVLFFGWKQLPDMARSAGRSLRVFRTEVTGLTEDLHGTTGPVAAPAAVAEVVSPIPAVAAAPKTGAGAELAN